MNEDGFSKAQGEELIKLFKDMDWKLWEIYNMMRLVLTPPEETTKEADDN